jgi:hypothetical protein
MFNQNYNRNQDPEMSLPEVILMLSAMLILAGLKTYQTCKKVNTIIQEFRTGIKR